MGGCVSVRESVGGSVCVYVCGCVWVCGKVWVVVKWVCKRVCECRIV
jgi:hypothetical protein